MENIIHVTLSVYKNEDISESKEYNWSGMYGDASPTPIAVNKKIKFFFFFSPPKTGRRQSHCFQGRTLLIPNFSWSWMFSTNLQWLYRAVFAGDLMTGCIIKSCLWAPPLEVRKARLKHPYIMLLPLLLPRRRAILLSDNALGWSSHPFSEAAAMHKAQCTFVESVEMPLLQESHRVHLESVCVML